MGGDIPCARAEKLRDGRAVPQRIAVQQWVERASRQRGRIVNNHTLRGYAGRDAAFVRQQVRGILNPNIVVCGGGSGCLLRIAQEFIYPDLTFFPINSWCHYCKDPELLLINSWHPSSRILDSQKIDGMMQAVAGFMVQTHADIFH